MYNLTPDELSAKGSGGRRQLYNYVSAAQDVFSIPTPDDNYKPDKISSDLTVDNIQEKRRAEIQPNANPFVAKI
jgi:hypothetical protein